MSAQRPSFLLMASPDQKRMCVYILASKRNGTLYTGVTSDLRKRVWEHQNHLADGFTKKYNVNRLVYYEVHDNPTTAIKREKSLKRWHRDWKLKLIEKENPNWDDLYPSL
ncbi:MAG TPA: GIY-YIG nuclease family protein [Myxococcota bacterium]|nr:GIY-YIG nuclease family protein [Myxococcota bacterium]